jgi:hypothetical protein
MIELILIAMQLVGIRLGAALAHLIERKLLLV